MKLIKIIIVMVFLLSYVGVQGQVNEARQQYEKFRKQARTQYNDFRNEANRKYAEFLKQAWEQYNILPAIERPKDEQVPPIVMPEEDLNKPIEDTPITIEDVVEPPTPDPMPVPVAPIREQPIEEKYMNFTYYGTKCKVRFNYKHHIFKLKGCKSDNIASAWLELSDEKYDNLIRDCLLLRSEMKLNDWAYLLLLRNMSEKFLGKGNEAKLLMAYIYSQSGYQMKLGVDKDDRNLYLLYSSKHNIYGKAYFSVANEHYYPFDCEESELLISGADFPKAQPLSLQIIHEMQLSNANSEVRELISKRYPEIKIQSKVNKNLITFYNGYPASEYNDNFMTKWSIYANTPMTAKVKSEIYPTFKEKLKGLRQKEAAERLLNWVQTAFVYELDDKVWGQDRAFFAEESLYYPFCDCEDRSILFSRLVRDLLGLKVILVYYPGHLATAVHFTDDVKGDYILLNKEKYVVCDPTYIGAPVGNTMRNMDNSSATVILLKN